MRLAKLTAVALLGTVFGCTQYYFSGIEYPDRSRPVAKIETRGGVEYGATTTEGILFLGRTAQAGPCRVHYFLGAEPTPMVENGEIHHLGGVFYVADIDLKNQHVDILARDPKPTDSLLAIEHGGHNTREIPVQFADNPAIEGNILAWPGQALPAGTAVFVREDESLKLVGLVSGMVTIEGGLPARYLTLAGTDQLREMLAVPRLHPPASKIMYRPDGINVIKSK